MANASPKAFQDAVKGRVYHPMDPHHQYQCQLGSQRLSAIDSEQDPVKQMELIMQGAKIGPGSTIVTPFYWHLVRFFALSQRPVQTDSN